MADEVAAQDKTKPNQGFNSRVNTLFNQYKNIFKEEGKESEEKNFRLIVVPLSGSNIAPLNGIGSSNGHHCYNGRLL